MLTAWKKTEELAFLNEVSSVPLQQALRHLQTAFTNFFGKRAKYPRFKSRKKSRKSAEYTTSAFRFRDGKLTLAKMARAAGHRVVPAAPRGRGAVHGDRVAGRGRTLVRVHAVRGPVRAAAPRHGYGRRYRRRAWTTC